MVQKKKNQFGKWENIKETLERKLLFLKKEKKKERGLLFGNLLQ